MRRRGKAGVAAGSAAGPRAPVSCSYSIDRQVKQTEYQQEQERIAPHRDTSADTTLHSVAALLLLQSVFPTDRVSQPASQTSTWNFHLVRAAQGWGSDLFLTQFCQ